MANKYEFCRVDKGSTQYAYRYGDGKCRAFGPFYVKWKTGGRWTTLAGYKVLYAFKGKLAGAWQAKIARECRDAGVPTVGLNSGVLAVFYGGLRWASVSLTEQVEWRRLVEVEGDYSLDNVSPTDLAHVLREYPECPHARRLLEALTNPGDRPEADCWERADEGDMPF